MLPSMIIFRVMMRVLGQKCCYMRGKFAGNRSKMRVKFVVNRGCIRGKCAENHRKLRWLSAENRGQLRSVALERTFPFSVSEMIIFSVHLFKRPVASSFKKYD
jgi:hypothetical protein